MEGSGYALQRDLEAGYFSCGVETARAVHVTFDLDKAPV